MKDLGGHILSWGGIRESVGKPERFLCWWPSGLCSCCCVECGLENRPGGAWRRNCEGGRKVLRDARGPGQQFSHKTQSCFAILFEELDLYF